MQSQFSIFEKVTKYYVKRQPAQQRINTESAAHCYICELQLLFPLFSLASNIVLMSNKAVLVDFGLTVQMTEDMYIPRDLRGTEVRK